MLRRFLKTFWWLLVLGILTMFIFLGLGSLTSQTAMAAVSKLEGTPKETIYRSQLKLDDQSGKVWQVILWKQIYLDQAPSINLRLVGFPGSAEFIHPQPLHITTDAGEVLNAPDVFLEEAPAPTIGQYDFKDILPKLPTESIQLGIPLPGKRLINISVPKSVVKEWKSVMEMGNGD